MEKPLFPRIVIQVKIRQNWKPGYIWDVFDVIIAQMEKVDPKTGEPMTTVMDRKRFRVEVMRVRDEEIVAVFKKWVTVITRHVGAGTPAEKKMAKAKEDDAPLIDMTERSKKRSRVGESSRRRKLTREEKDHINARDRERRLKKAEKAKAKAKMTAGTK